MTRAEYVIFVVQSIAAAATVIAAWAAYRSASASERAVYEAAKLSYRLESADDLRRLTALVEELKRFQGEEGPHSMPDIHLFQARIAELLERDDILPACRRVAAGADQKGAIDEAVLEVEEQIGPIRRYLAGEPPRRPDKLWPRVRSALHRRPLR